MSTKTAKARETRKTLARRLLEGTQRNDLNEVKAAIEEGAEVDVLDENGSAAIHTAALCNLRQILKILIASNANLNLKQSKKDQCTAAHVAAAVGNVKCLYMLLQAGADMAVKNKRGKTVMEWAIQHNQAACVQVLCTFMEAQRMGVPVAPNPELEAELPRIAPVAPTLAGSPVALPAGYHPIDQVQNLERRASQAESKMSELAMKLREAEDAVRRYRKQLGEDETKAAGASLPPPPSAAIKVSLPPPPPPATAKTAPTASPAASPAAKTVIAPVLRLSTPGRSASAAVPKAATMTSPIRMGVIHLLGLENESSIDSASSELCSEDSSPVHALESPQPSLTPAVRAGSAAVAASPVRNPVITREALLAAARSLQPATPSRPVKAATLPAAFCVAGVSPAPEALTSVLNEIRAGVTLRRADNQRVENNAPSLMDELKRTLKLKRRHMRQESRMSEDWSIAATAAAAANKSPVKMMQSPQQVETPRKVTCASIIESSSSTSSCTNEISTVASLVDSIQISNDKENVF